MDQIIENLFESVPKARILRLLVRNSDQKFSLDEIAARSQVRKPAVRRELQKMIRYGLAEERVVSREIKTDKSPKARFKKERVYGINPKYYLLRELYDLITKASVAPHDKLLKQIRGIGKIKLAIISGVFTQSENARTDLLIIGDGISKRKLDRFLAHAESELGKPIQHTVMETDEFQYRMDMYDRFLRDILEYPHEKIINRFNL
jgi:hypothetical protein